MIHCESQVGFRAQRHSSPRSLVCFNGNREQTVEFAVNALRETACLGLAAALCLAASGSAAQNLSVSGGWLVQVEEGRAVPNPGIVVVAGKIHEIGRVAPAFPRLALQEDEEGMLF